MMISSARKLLQSSWHVPRNAGLLLALLLASAAASATPPDAPHVRIAAGVIAGKLAQVDGVTLRAFHGIPYAAPPLAALRWQPPQPLPPWQGTRLARSEEHTSELQSQMRISYAV